MKPGQGARLVGPARAGDVQRAGVVAQPGQLHPHVPGARVDGQPLPAPGLAHQAPAVGDRLVQQPGLDEGEAERARAVVATVQQPAVAAAPDVGRPGDRVRRGDHLLDHRRRAGGCDRQTVRQQLRALTGHALDLLEGGANLVVRRGLVGDRPRGGLGQLLLGVARHLDLHLGLRRGADVGLDGLDPVLSPEAQRGVVGRGPVGPRAFVVLGGAAGRDEGEGERERDESQPAGAHAGDDGM